MCGKARTGRGACVKKGLLRSNAGANAGANAGNVLMYATQRGRERACEHGQPAAWYCAPTGLLMVAIYASFAAVTSARRRYIVQQQQCIPASASAVPYAQRGMRHGCRLLTGMGTSHALLYCVPLLVYRGPAGLVQIEGCAVVQQAA